MGRCNTVRDTMHHNALQPHHLAHQILDNGSNLAEIALQMAPRHAHPHPQPESLPDGGPVTGFGTVLNLSSAAEPYTHGLQGVNQSMNWTFVYVLTTSFLGLMAITLLYRWFHMGNSHLRRLFTMGKWKDQRYWMYNHTHFWPRIKRHMIYAPLFRVRHNKEFQLSNAVTIGTIPSRFHTILLLTYLASNLAYCLVLNWTREDTYSIVAELRGRTGSLAVLNLIPTVLFAMRNNPLIPLLGVSYDTFNLLHRWFARVVVLEAIIHSICWALNSLSAGGMHQLNISLSTSISYMWGMVATATFTFIFLTACSPLRHAFYEVFLNAHRVLVLLGLIGVYVHLDKANLPQLPYVQLCLALWFAELMCRSLRILFHNFSRHTGITRITVEALPAEACRVTFDLSRPWRWQPGCHVHAYLPAVSLWSSHPFSVAWAENYLQYSPFRDIELEEKLPATSRHYSLPPPPVPPKPAQERLPRRSMARFTMARFSMAFSKKNGHEALATIAELAKKSDSASIALARDAGLTSVSLIVRARAGMTRHIYEKAIASPNGSFTTWGAVEGPYGGHESLASYGTVLLFAGGVGITHCVGYVYHLLCQYQAGSTSTRKILLVWSVPNTEALEWVRVWMDKILRMEARRDVLRIQLFVTKPRHRGEVISNTGSVQMFPGRCQPRTVVQKEMKDRIGAMGVMVCGPGAFADSVRAAVREEVEVGSVDFVEEAFTY